MEGTVFTPALQEIEHVKSDQGEILSKPFLDACKHILPVIGASCSLPCYWHKNNIRKEHIDVILDYGHFPSVSSIYFVFFLMVRGNLIIIFL